MKGAKIFFSVLVSVLFLFLFFRYIPLSSVLESFRGANYLFIAGFFLANLGVYVLKALRFKTYLSEIGYGTLLKISAIHAFALNVLPVRSGELVFPLFLKKHNVSYSKSVGFLMLLRLLDVLAVIIIFFIGLTFLGYFPEVISYPLLMAITALVTFLVASMIFLAPLYIGLIEFFSWILLVNKVAILNKIKQYLIKLLKEVSRISKAKVILLLAESLVVWMLNAVAIYFSILTLIPVGFTEAIIISSLLTFSVMIPIHGFMGFGTSEATPFIILTAFSVPAAQALSVGFIFHFCYLGSALLYGGVAWIFHLLERKPKDGQEFY